ncbi:MAG: hypothetical protein JJU29_21930 [Verrucomicrobia bacterium]|nr:hypothetical protein [Verrucomicrobiota bacterium]MCH8511450.1 hypothetical protein [Kiritimatiellia bacterium]
MHPAFRLSILLFLAFLSSGLSANEIRNGDFSEASRFWFVFVNGGYRSPEDLSDFIHAGEDGLRLSVHEIPGDKAQPADVTFNQRVRALRDGVEYVLRFEVRGHGDESMLVGVGNPVTSGANRGNLAGGIPVREIAMQNDWQSVEISFVYNADNRLNLPEDAAETLLQFRVGMLSSLQIRAVSITGK